MIFKISSHISVPQITDQFKVYVVVRGDASPEESKVYTFNNNVSDVKPIISIIDLLTIGWPGTYINRFTHETLNIKILKESKGLELDDPLSIYAGFAGWDQNRPSRYNSIIKIDVVYYDENGIDHEVIFSKTEKFQRIWLKAQTY